MTRRRQVLTAVAVAVLAAAGGFGLHQWRAIGNETAEAARAILSARIPDLDGRERTLSEWTGKVLVVNYWATWCAPCREEIPMFVRMQDRYRDRGLQFVGIAIDRPEPVARFAEEYRINYPLLIGRIETVELSRKAGNRAGGLPFTMVFDRRGRLAGTALGEVKEPKLEAILAALW